MMGDQHGAVNPGASHVWITSLQHQWTSKQALIFVTACLAVRITGGWLIRGNQNAKPSSSQVARASATTAIANTATLPPGSNSLSEMADTQAAPLLMKLSADPKNPDTLISIGNLDYDAQQYPVAVDFYNRALQSRPSDASVRTDMADCLLVPATLKKQLRNSNKALTFAPTNPNTLFNLGLVKWQGKHDGAGAIADWNKLLEANPNYEQKDKVRKMLSDVERQIATKASTGA